MLGQDEEKLASSCEKELELLKKRLTTNKRLIQKSEVQKHDLDRASKKSQLKAKLFPIKMFDWKNKYQQLSLKNDLLQADFEKIQLSLHKSEIGERKALKDLDAVKLEKDKLTEKLAFVQTLIRKSVSLSSGFSDNVQTFERCNSEILTKMLELVAYDFGKPKPPVKESKLKKTGFTASFYFLRIPIGKKRKLF